MTQRVQMTLLQRAVIHRLHEAGYNELADCARDAWRRGQPCNLPNMVSSRHAQLRADYEKANGQAGADD